MAQSYTRQSTFADGDTITAALFNNESTHLHTVLVALQVLDTDTMAQQDTVVTYTQSVT